MEAVDLNSSSNLRGAELTCGRCGSSALFQREVIVTPEMSRDDKKLIVLLSDEDPICPNCGAAISRRTPLLMLVPDYPIPLIVPSADIGAAIREDIQAIKSVLERAESNIVEQLFGKRNKAGINVVRRGARNILISDLPEDHGVRCSLNGNHDLRRRESRSHYSG